MKVLVSIQGDSDEAMRDLVRKHGVLDIAQVDRKGRRVEAIVDEERVATLGSAGYHVTVKQGEKDAAARRNDIAWHPDDDPAGPKPPHRGWPWPRPRLPFPRPVDPRRPE